MSNLRQEPRLKVSILVIHFIIIFIIIFISEAMSTFVALRNTREKQ